LLGISEMRVYREIHRGKLPAAQLGRIYVITRSNLEGWLGQERTRAMLGEIEPETLEWLSTVAQDTADRLDALESELPPGQLSAWHEAMSCAAKPARYIPGKGVVFEEEV